MVCEGVVPPDPENKMGKGCCCEYDRSQEPSCLCKFCCLPCTVTGYEGSSTNAMIAWILWWFSGDMLTLIMCILWSPKIYGKDYGPAVGQPVGATGDKPPQMSEP